MKFIVEPEYIIIDDFYDDNELQLIWQELEFITYEHKLLPESSTHTAYTPNGIPKKSNRGVWLDQLFYDHREFSNILNVNRKLYQMLLEPPFSDHLVFSTAQFINFDSTLISYYENGDYYEPHRDSAVFTACTWFYKEPKQFSGGDLILYDRFGDGHLIEVKNNRVAFFRSGNTHQVTPIRCDVEGTFHKQGRYTMTQLMNVAHSSS